MKWRSRAWLIWVCISRSRGLSDIYICRLQAQDLLEQVWSISLFSDLEQENFFSSCPQKKTKWLKLRFQCIEEEERKRRRKNSSSNTQKICIFESWRILSKSDVLHLQLIQHLSIIALPPTASSENV